MSDIEQNKNDDVCKETVFNEVFRLHSPDLYKFLYYKFGEDLGPEDIVQEAFVKLWDNCKKVTKEKAKSYLFTVANNLMLNMVSKSSTARKYQSEIVEKKDTQTPQYKLESKEYEQQLNKAIADLNEEQRVAFLLNRVEGKKHQEIADMLGISRKGVEKRIYTALAKLRKELDYFK